MNKFDYKKNENNIENNCYLNDYKISVLMSVYKDEKAENFDLALKSILVDQQLIPNELILIVDGPISNELNTVVLKYLTKFSNIMSVYRLGSNHGLGYALRFGLTKCKYEYVARADSDDICNPERFKIQIDFFKNNPKVDILSSYIEEFEEDYFKPIARKELPLNHDGICKMAKFRNPINHMAVMFRKEKILNCGSYKELPYVEDYYLWVRAIVNGCTLANIDKCLVHARVGNGMIGRRGNRAYIKSWFKLNEFMLKNKIISTAEYMRNMTAICTFVYLPPCLKSLVYRLMLREKRASV